MCSPIFEMWYSLKIGVGTNIDENVIRVRVRRLLLTAASSRRNLKHNCVQGMYVKLFKSLECLENGGLLNFNKNNASLLTVKFVW